MTYSLKRQDSIKFYCFIFFYFIARKSKVWQAEGFARSPTSDVGCVPVTTGYWNLYSEKIDFSSKFWPNFWHPNLVPNTVKYSSIWPETKTIRRKILNSLSNKALELKRIVKLYALLILAPKFLDLSFSQKFKTSSPAPPYYSSSIMEICSTSHSRLRPSPTSDVGCVPVTTGYWNLHSEKIDFLSNFS